MRRLTFPQITLPQQPLVFMALALIAGLLIASRASWSARLWLNALVVSWVAGLLCWRWQTPAWLVTALLVIGFVAHGGSLWALHKANVAPHTCQPLV